MDRRAWLVERRAANVAEYDAEAAVATRRGALSARAGLTAAAIESEPQPAGRPRALAPSPAIR